MVSIIGQEVIVRIIKTQRGFVLSISDLESGERLPSCIIFPTLQAAASYASKCLEVY